MLLSRKWSSIRSPLLECFLVQHGKAVPVEDHADESAEHHAAKLEALPVSNELAIDSNAIEADCKHQRQVVQHGESKIYPQLLFRVGPHASPYERVMVEAEEVVEVLRSVLRKGKERENGSVTIFLANARSTRDFGFYLDCHRLHDAITKIVDARARAQELPIQHAGLPFGVANDEVVRTIV